MNNEHQDQKRLYMMCQNCKKMNIIIIPPHINHSKFKFTINKKKQIVYGLCGLKGIGSKVASHFIEERKIGEYINMYDFCHRIDRRKIDPTILETLIFAGVFDGMGSTRAELHSSRIKALLLSEQTKNSWRNGMGDLFGGVDINDTSIYQDKEQPSVWSREEMLQNEHQAIGHYITDHPCTPWKEEIAKITTNDLSILAEDLGTIDSTKIVVAGVVTSKKRFLTDKGEIAYLVTIDDDDNQSTITLFEENHNTNAAIVGHIIVVEIERSHTNKKFIYSRVKHIISLRLARFHYARAIAFKISGNNSTQQEIANLRSLLSPHLKPKGKLVIIRVQNDISPTEIKLGDQWRLRVSTEFLLNLEQKCPNVEISPIF